MSLRVPLVGMLVDEGKVSGWDDPRMPTISGLRRLGYTPESIRRFAETVGVAKRNSTVDLDLLKWSLREELNRTADRVMVVLRPLKVVITDYPEDETEWIDAPVSGGSEGAVNGTLAGIAVSGMAVNGVTGDVADQIFEKLAAFANFGFPESHSVSFAYLVYASSWFKLHYPAAFCASLLNAQPMGFYGPGTLVHDARRRGVEVRPPDLGKSRWLCSIEASDKPPDPPQEGTVVDIRGPNRAVRLGMRLVQGLGPVARERLEGALKGLNQDQREVFLMRENLGLPFKIPLMSV